MSIVLEPLDLLLEFDAAISWPDLENVTARTLSFFEARFELDRITLLLLNADRSILNVYQHDNSSSTPPVCKPFAMDKDISAHFLLDIRPEYFPTLSPRKAPSILKKDLLSFGFKSCFNIPLIVGDAPIGSLNVASNTENGINAITRQLLVLLSSRLALALYHAHLHDELVHREHQLTTSEKSYRELVDQAGDVIIKGNADGLIIQVNDAATRRFGYSTQELCSMHISDLFDPAVLESKPLRFDLLDQGRNVIRERALRCKDGSTLPVEMNSKKMADGSLLSIIRDLSERKASNDQLLNQKNQISALLDAVSTPLYAKDKTGHFTMLNDAYLEFFGKTREEMLGNTATDDWPGASTKHLAKEELLFLVNNERATLPLELKNAAGEIRQVVERRTRFTDARGEVAGFVGTLIDYTDLKAAEDRYQTLFTSSPDPIVVHDGKVVLAANQAAVAFFKAEAPDTYIGSPVSAFIHPDSLQDSRRRIQELSSSAQANELMHQKFIVSDGTVRDVEVMAVPIKYDGHLVIMTSFRDITLQKQAFDLLRSSEENYRNLIEATPTPIVVHVKNTLVYANPAALDFAGITNLEDYIGLDLTTLIHPDSLEAANKTSELIAATRKPQPLARRKFLRTNGEVRQVESMGSPINFVGQEAIMVFFRDLTDEVLTRDELAMTEERYRRAFNYSPNAMVLHDKGILVDANQAALDFVGAKHLDDLIGKDIFRFIHRDFVDLSRDGVDEILKNDSGGPLREQIFLTLSGQERWVESRSFPVHQAGKSLILASFNDIHDQVMARKQAEESRQQLELITQHLTSFLLLIDLDFTFLYMNRAASKWLRKTNEELVGLHIKEIANHNEFALMKKFIPQLLKGEVCHFAHRYLSRSGKLVDVWITLIPVQGEDGAVLAFLAQVEDVTEREAARKDLAENKELLELIVDTIPGLFSYADVNEKYLYVNKAYADWYGKEKSEMVGRSFKQVLARDTYTFIKPYLTKISQGKSQYYSREVLDRKDQKHVLDVHYIPHLDDKGNTKAFLTSLQDVTEQRRIESRQRALQELASALTKTMDLKTVGLVAANTLRSVFESDALSIELYDQDKKVVVNVYTEDTFRGKALPEEVENASIPFSKLSKRWFSASTIAHCENRPGTRLKKPKTILFGSKRLSRSLLYAPVRWENQVIGMVSVQSYVFNKYSSADLPLLQTFADQTGGALMRTQKDAQIREHQNALEKEEQKYRSIIENAGDSVFVTTFAGKILTVNDHACRTLGYSEVELIKMNLKTIDPKFFRQYKGDALVSLKKGSEALTIESEHHRKDGSSLHVELRVGTTEIDGVTALLFFVRNISDRKLADKRERSLRYLAHDLNDSTTMYTIGEMAARSIRSFFESDAFTIEFFDHEKREILGVYSEDTFEGERKPRSIPPLNTRFEDVSAKFFFLNSVTHVRNRTTKELAKVNHNRPFGSARLSHSLLFAPIFWSGKHVGVLSVQSYTDNKYGEADLPNVQTFADQIGSALIRAKKDEELVAKQAELQESELKYRSMIENAGDALFVASFQGQILAFNQHATASLGYNESELLTLRLQSFCPGFTREFPRKRLNELIKTGASLTLETTHFRKDGSTFPVELRVGTMELKGKQCILFFARDVSERTENEIFRTALGRLARQLTVSLDPRQVGELAASVLYDLFDYDAFALYKIDLEQRVATGLFAQDTFRGDKKPIEVSQGTTPLDVPDHRAVFVISSSVLINRTSETSSQDLSPYGDVNRRSKSLVFVPVFFEGVQIGLFSLQSYSPEKFTETDLPKLKIFANQIGGALVRAQTDEVLLAQTASLKERELELETLLQEKEVLLKEVYHRTKNNMQVVVGLLEMYSLKTKNIQTRSVLGEMTNRIYSMSMVHDLLYRSKNLAEIRLRDYLEKLVTRLVAAYKTSKNEVDVLISAESIPIDIQVAVPLGLVINEIVTNSLKYAFPDDRDGQVEISAKVQGEKGLLLSIKDNGVGLQKDFDPNKSKTLGMRIIQDIVQLQLFGELTCSNNSGVEYIINIPDLIID